MHQLPHEMRQLPRYAQALYQRKKLLQDTLSISRSVRVVQNFYTVVMQQLEQLTRVLGSIFFRWIIPKHGELGVSVDPL